MERYIVCFGAVNLDLLYDVPDIEGFLEAWGTGLKRGGEEALSINEEARLLELLPRFAKEKGRFGGGQAANTAYALARLEVPVVLLGRVGADPNGEFLKESLRGVTLDYLITQGKSGRAYILIDPEGERTILVAPNTNDELRETDIPLDLLTHATFIHVTSFVGDGPLEVQRRLFKLLSSRARITFDPGELYARRGWQALEDLLDKTETLLVTEREWQLLGGDLKHHPNWGPPVVLIKRGALGARLLTPVRYLDFSPFFSMKVVDTLGAGDVFAAGYLAGLFLGLNLPQAVRLATALAAYKVAGAGRERYPDRKIMEDLVASLR